MKTFKFWRENWQILLSALFFSAGLLVILYPAFSKVWNDRTMSSLHAAYLEQQGEDPEPIWEERIKGALAWNHKLVLLGEKRFFLTENLLDEYNLVAAREDDFPFAFIQIPKLNLSVPVYPTHEEKYIQAGCGHLEGSSYPTGNKGEHAVFFSHSGSPTKRLLSDIGSLEKGDTIEVDIWGRRLRFQVIRTLTVLPDQTESLAIDEEDSLLTLATCTPYGINSHRLLVSARFVERILLKDAQESFSLTSSDRILRLIWLTLLIYVLHILSYIGISRNKRLQFGPIQQKPIKKRRKKVSESDNSFS